MFPATTLTYLSLRTQVIVPSYVSGRPLTVDIRLRGSPDAKKPREYRISSVAGSSSNTSECGQQPGVRQMRTFTNLQTAHPNPHHTSLLHSPQDSVHRSRRYSPTDTSNARKLDVPAPRPKTWDFDAPSPRPAAMSLWPSRTGNRICGRASGRLGTLCCSTGGGGSVALRWVVDHFRLNQIFSRWNAERETPSCEVIRRHEICR